MQELTATQVAIIEALKLSSGLSGQALEDLDTELYDVCERLGVGTRPKKP